MVNATLKSLFIICISIFMGFILIFSTFQNYSFSESQVNIPPFLRGLPEPNVSSSNNTGFLMTPELEKKFDPGFEKKINDMINAGKTREYATIIVVKKAAENGLTADQVAKMNKEKLVDALINVHKATILYVGQKLSFVAANVPLKEISKLTNYDYVIAIGDGEGKLEPQSHSMSDLKTSIDARGLSVNGSKVKVAVLDTGIRQVQAQTPFTAHPDLPVGNKIISQTYCTFAGCSSTGNYTDFTNHGTHVAGIISGLGIISPSMSGVANATSIMNVKLDFTSGSLATGLDWALTNGAQVVNLSVAFPARPCFDTDSYNIITDEAVDEGAVVVAAAGNFGSYGAASISSPGCSVNAITVGAVDDKETASNSDDTIASFSSLGPAPSGRLKPDLVAPGMLVNSTDACYYYNDTNTMNNKICTTAINPSEPYINGTSFSTPQVSAAAALLLQSQPQYSPLQVKAALLLGAQWNPKNNGNVSNTATQYENGGSTDTTLNSWGFGYLDVAKSLSYANSGKNIITDTIVQGQDKNYTFSATSGNQVKVILSWLKHPQGNVTYPNDIGISNLDFYITRGDTGQTVISSTSKNQTNEFAVFNAPFTGTYTIKVTAPYVPSQLGGPQSPAETFALASTQEMTKGSYFVKEGTFAKSNNTGLQTISGLDFTPKALIMFTTGQSTSGFANNYTQSIGFSNGTYSRSITADSDYTNKKSLSGRAFGDSIVTILASGTPRITAQANLTGFAYGNFTLNWTVNDNTLSEIHYIALGGNDITGAAVSSFTAIPTTGTQQVTSVTFHPDFIMLMNANDTRETGTDSNAYLSYGFWGVVGPTQATIATASVNGLSVTNTKAIQLVSNLNPRILATLNAATASLVGQAIEATPSGNGFAIDWVNATTSPTKIYYLALKGGYYNIGNLNETTSGAPTTQSVTGLEFQPKGVLFSSINEAGSTSLQQNNRLSLGATDGVGQSAIWSGDTNGVRKAVGARSDNESETIALATEASPPSSSTPTGEAVISSLDPSGFTIKWEKTGSTPDQILYLAFGDVLDSSIVIQEQTRPTSTQTFSYATNAQPPFPPITLEDNGSGQQYPDTDTIGNLIPNTYYVNQSPNSAYLTTSSCSNGGTPDSIVLGGNQTVTCKFVNTKPSTIIIIEKTIPQNNTVFQFTSNTLSPSPFTLYDNNTGHNSTTFANLEPGIYNISEALLLIMP